MFSEGQYKWADVAVLNEIVPEWLKRSGGYWRDKAVKGLGGHTTSDVASKVRQARDIGEKIGRRANIDDMSTGQAVSTAIGKTGESAGTALRKLGKGFRQATAENPWGAAAAGAAGLLGAAALGKLRRRRQAPA